MLQFDVQTSHPDWDNSGYHNLIIPVPLGTRVTLECLSPTDWAFTYAGMHCTGRTGVIMDFTAEDPDWPVFEAFLYFPYMYRVALTHPDYEPLTFDVENHAAPEMPGGEIWVKKGEILHVDVPPGSTYNQFPNDDQPEITTDGVPVPEDGNYVFNSAELWNLQFFCYGYINNQYFVNVYE